jgi:hypothetical protein
VFEKTFFLLFNFERITCGEGGKEEKYVNSKLVASDKEVDEKVQQQKITKIIPSTVNNSLTPFSFSQFILSFT